MGLFQDAPALCRAPADGAPVLTPPTSTDPVHHAVRRTRVLASGLPRFDAGRFPARDTGQRSRGADGSLLLGFRGKVFLEAGVLPKKFFFFLLLSFLLRIQIGAEWTVAARQPRSAVCRLMSSATVWTLSPFRSDSACSGLDSH